MTKAEQLRLDTWELPLSMPREIDGLTTIGVPMPDYPEIEDFEEAWFSYDPLNWELDELNRREWATEITAHFDQWKRYLNHDSTWVFKRTVEQKRAKGGILVGIRGIKGGGKSRLAQMVMQRICNVTPHVLFQYKDIAMQIKQTEGDEVGLLIDEDLTATGADSANLVIHVNNSWETSRKAIQSGVCTGVNLSFERWGNTLDLRLEPCGINIEFLATRFAMFSKRDRFLGFGALQFKHLPEDPVFYYNELGTWQEYDDRASLFSRTVTRSGGALDAVDAPSQTAHIERLRAELKARYVDKALKMPPDMACRRIYRQCELPAKSIGYMNEVIWWAKYELEENPENPRRVAITKEGWDGLREGFTSLILKHGGTARQAEKAVAWLVPEWPLASESQVGERLAVGRDAIQKAKKRGLADISNVELGDLGERFLAAHIDSPCTTAGGTKGQPDILMHHPAGPIAINVKLSAEKTFRRSIETTPEDSYLPRAVVALIMHRRLEVVLFPIAGPETMLNSNKGVLCAPENIEQTLQEMIED